MVRFKMLVLCVLIAIPIIASNLFAQEKSDAKYQKGYAIDGNGDKVEWVRWAGFPPEKPVTNQVDPNEVYSKEGGKALVKLNNVPAYDWSYGCTATATAMFVAYYDNFGAPNCYTGPANGGVAPLSNAVWQTSSQPDTSMLPIAASKNGVDGRSTRGHGDDYWEQYNEAETNDPYYGNWTEHDYYAGQPCTADFMGTNQWNNWGNIDGSTSIWNYNNPSGAKLFDMPDQTAPPGRDGTHGMRLFFESLGMEVQQNFNQKITGYNDPADDPDEGPVVGGYEFAHFKRSIDQGRPVIVHVEGHSMTGYGYDEAYTPPRVYLRSTWYRNYTDAEYMSWGGTFSAMQHYGMSEIILATKEYYATPENVLALNNNRTVTVTWDDPSAGTRPLTYIVYRDGAQIATRSVPNYSETLASSFDGVHSYSVKAVYTAPEPDYTTGMSDASSVYVCASVLSFSDTFENTWAAQWLFTPASGTTGGWGRDTATTNGYVYAGTYSLSDSPNANYVDNTELYAKGGSVAEVAPGLNFSAALDCQTSFYLRYQIEESFDYLYYQFTEDGSNWITLGTWSSEAITTWNLVTIKHGHLAGNSNVRFRFLLKTDQGYNAAGSNIDNFNITPASVDTTPPFVYYTNARDWHKEADGGYEITTVIKDRTGIDYARVLYKVNGGAEQSAEPTSVNGTTYYWKLPVAPAAGDLVEFRFDCRDTVSPTKNQGYTGPWQYVEGLHQKYDSGFVSYYTYCVTTTAQYDMKSYAVRFQSFHDDIVGAVVRGYTDATTEYEDGLNCDMVINVWADNAGLPGATLITPFNFANPATLQNTNAWGFVDLKAYTALDDMAASFYIGFQARTGQTGRTLCRTVGTATGAALEYDFGRAYIQSYYTAGGSLTWEQYAGNNHHIRCITTDYKISPPIIVPPDPVVKSVDENSTDTEVVYVGNAGNYPLSYEASITYDGMQAPGGSLHTNDFSTFPGTGYTNSGWVSYNGGASATGDGVTAVLTTPVINTSAITSDVYLDFNSNFVFRTGSYARVEYYTGSAWTQILNLTANSTAPQHILLPIKSANTQVRFTGYTTKVSGTTARWTIDNIAVSYLDVPYTWLTLDGAATTSGSVAAAGTDPLTYGFNTAGLTLGNTYTATVTVSDAEGVVTSKTASVSLTVENTGGPVIPGVPANVTTSIVGGNVFINWDDAADATNYDVYSSATPYGTFAFLANVATSEYTYTPTATKMFFQIISKNATKTDTPQTIEVKAIKRKTLKDVKLGNSGN
jgi:hypothetical protein